VSRNTVTAHLRRVQGALGLNLQDARSRAELALALAITGLPLPDGSAAVENAPTPSVDSLLSTEGSSARTARNLGISRTTVRFHLRTAERLLQRSLLFTRSASPTVCREQPQDRGHHHADTSEWSR
jgi:DNA-binding CsgD family transcriptional regulator